MTYTIAEPRQSSGAYLLLLWIVTTMILWFFAFYHAPESTPEWLRRAQAACFGTTESGLPNSGGWIILIFAPLSILVALFVGLGGELRDGIIAAKESAAWRIGSIILLCVLALQIFWVSSRIKDGVDIVNLSFESQSTGGLPSGYQRLNKPTPSFSLVNQRGERVSPEKYRGKPVFISFFFAHCKTVCPVIVRSLQNAKDSLKGSPDVPVLLVTLDPWRDTPRSLPDLYSTWGFKNGEEVLSGEVNEVNSVIKAFEVPTDRSEVDGDIVHPALVYVLDSSGNIAYAFNNPSPSWLVDAAKILSGEKIG